MKKKTEEEDKKKASKSKVNNTVDLEPETEDEISEEAFIEMYVLDEDTSDVNEPEISSILNELKEALSHTQRIKKKMVMKKYKNKLKIARKRSSRRRANLKVIKKRARRQAISNVKKMVTKGKNMKKASASEKSRVERIVKRRKVLVDRGARKLIKHKRSADTKRLQKSSYEMSGPTLNEIFSAYYDSIKKDN
jgi:hypothetical protein